MESPEGKTVGPKRPGRFRFVGAVEASAALACVGTLTAFLDLGWLPELTSHLRPQYAVLLVAAAVGFGVLKRPKRAVLFGCFALLNVLALAPWLFSRSATTSEGTAFRVLVLNVNTANTRHDAVRAEIRRLDPDVVLVMEVDNLWLEQLRELRTKWPHWVTAPRPDNFGIALFSKRELSDAVPRKLATQECPPSSPRWTHILSPFCCWARSRSRREGRRTQSCATSSWHCWLHESTPPTNLPSSSAI
jgi:endonuclease/exonuclease/phosphatase (EEP) superfamily protein YafD